MRHKFIQYFTIIILFHIRQLKKKSNHVSKTINEHNWNNWNQIVILFITPIVSKIINEIENDKFFMN